MIAEIATAIATRMTITLRRDLEERLAAVSRSLLPVMESCSPRFAGFGWIWSKEIVSFSDDVILDEISRRGCRIYFTLNLLRNKVTCMKKIIRQMIPYTPSFSLWPKKVNPASLVILKVCSSAWLSVSSFSFNCWWCSYAWYFLHKRDLESRSFEPHVTLRYFPER